MVLKGSQATVSLSLRRQHQQQQEQQQQQQQEKQEQLQQHESTVLGLKTMDKTVKPMVPKTRSKYH